MDQNHDTQVKIGKTVLIILWREFRILKLLHDRSGKTWNWKVRLILY